MNNEDGIEVDAFSDTYLAAKLLAMYTYTALLATFVPPGGNYKHFHLVWKAYPFMWYGKCSAAVTQWYSQLFSLASRDVKGSPESQKS